MPRSSTYLFLVCLLLGASTVFGQLEQYSVTGQLLVKVKTSQFDAEPMAGANANLESPIQKIIREYGITSFEIKYPNVDYLREYYHVNFTDTLRTEELIQELQTSKEVELVERVPLIMANGAIPPDAEDPKMWHLHKINQQGWDYWQQLNGKGRIVKIAIVDDGVRTTHEDLRDVIYKRPGEIPGNRIDDDLNGYVDDVVGYDVADNDNDPNPPADASNSHFSHGTRVAGLASASTDNGKGIASLGLNTRIVPIKCVSSEGPSSDYQHVWKGMIYAIQAQVDIINCSWSQYYLGDDEKRILNEILANKIIVVASAGNWEEEVPMYPAAYEGVLAVGATNSNDQVWSGSNFGEFIDVMAPGVQMFSTTATFDDSYDYGNGTSYAAPVVSGFLGLILSQVDDPDKAIEILKRGCMEIDIENPDKIGKMGAGRIDIDRTLKILIEGLQGVHLNKANSIQVYPNPTKGIVHFPADFYATEMRVYDLSGKEVAHINAPGTQVDLREYQLNGMHILHIQSDEGLFIARVLFQ